MTGDTTSLELWLQSDAGVERGGWSLDHVCVVADADAQATPEDDRPGWRPDGSGAMVSTCGCGTSGQPMGALVVLALALVRRFR